MQTPSSTSRIKRQKKGMKTATRIFIAFLLLFLAGTSHLLAQSGPGVTARFANPEFDVSTERYCVDVEFQASTDDVEITGINARFFFDNDLLGLVSFEDFQGGYGRANQGQIEPEDIGDTGDGDFFSFNGNALFINDAIELLDENAEPILLSSTEWTYLFRACFEIRDEDFLEIDEFCPSIVWDLQDPDGDNSFLSGSEGLVITVAGDDECILATEEADQFNWSYDPENGSYGFPEPMDCVSTVTIPIASWSLLIAGMFIAIFIILINRFL